MRLADFRCGGLRLSVAVAMALAWSGLAHRAAAAPVAASRPSAVLTSLPAEQAARRLDTIITAMEQADKAAPRDDFDPAAVVAAVGKDPSTLTAWVRANTEWVAYQGSLRGAQGTLMDRRGNSLDRSLLLADLLSRAGAKPRLAHGRLTAPAAVLQTLRKAAQPPAGSTKRPFSDEEAMIKTAQSLGVEQSAFEALSLERRTVQDRMNARVASQAAMLAKMVPAPAKPADDDPQLAALADHWWVQAQVGGEWKDFDALAAADAKTALTTPSETMDPRQLPAKLLHEVTVTVVVERCFQGKLSEQTVLKHPLAAPQVIGESIELVHRPENFRPPKDQAADALKRDLLAVKKWTPVLSVGSRKVTQKSFAADGSVESGGGGGGLGGFGGGMGGLGALGGDEDASAKGSLTAEFLDFEIHSPGRPDLKIRRTLYDAIGPAARAAGKPQPPRDDEAARWSAVLSRLGPVQILPQVCRVPAQYQRHVISDRIVRARKAMLAYAADPDQPALRRAAAATLKGALEPAAALAAARFTLGEGADDVFIDRPNVLACRTVVATADRKAAPLGLSYALEFDIVNNDMGVRPSASDSAFSRRMVQGVADTVAEAWVLGALGPARNTSELFDRPQSMAEPAALVKPAGTIQWNSDDIRQRALADAADGCAVVVARTAASAGQPSQQAWWRVDIATGSTLGVLEDGAHGSLLEYRLVETVGEYGPVFLTVGDCLAWAFCFIATLPFIFFGIWLFAEACSSAGREPITGRSGGVRG
jgi:hypothetical protein